MKERLAFLDFEFSGIVEEKVWLVCCTVEDAATGELEDFWLHKNPSEQKRLATHLKKFTTFFAWSAIAECRSFIALGLDPLKFKWIDGYLEYKMLTNSNYKLSTGWQLVDGKEKYIQLPKPKWERTEEDEAGFRPTGSLAEATYKLTGKIRDTDHKKKMRDLIISYPEKFTTKEKNDIQKYCREDVKFLKVMWRKMRDEFNELIVDENLRKLYIPEARLRGEYAALTAEMETLGYPINIKAAKNFSKQVGNILYDVQKEINGLFPDIKPFRWDRPHQRFAWNQKITREWININCDIEKWKKTDGGKKKKPDLSLSLEAFEKFFDFKHSYPEDNFGAQMVRFLKLKQSLAGFSTDSTSDKKTLWSSVGSDGRVRPYFNIYGAQTSRSQPAATGFMFLKPAWMRALVQPHPGKFIGGIDYGSEEYLISALNANCKGMIRGYLSGDPYLELAKDAMAIPRNGTKEEYKEIRNVFKNTCLAILFLMSKYGLSKKLSSDTGKYWDEDEAQDMIDIFYDINWELKEFQDDVVEQYKYDRYLKLPCGWYLFGDNENHRSYANMPIQGSGATIMRKAVKLARDRGCKIIFTLHDALYIEGNVGEEEIMIELRDSMREAFVSIFPKSQHATAKKIKLDPFIWGPDYKKDSSILLGKEKWEVACSNLYVDDRSINDYNKFSKYFEDRPEDFL